MPAFQLWLWNRLHGAFLGYGDIMAIKSRSGIGGPRTQEGKLRASKNSFKHGLTSSNPSGDHETQLIASLTKELIGYYKPQSPLEFLQIERIATCRAKLSHLYEVEQVRLALAHKELDLHPEKILEKISGAVGITKLMTLEIIEGQKIAPVCGLEFELLIAIVSEIHMFNGSVASVQQFIETFPLLVRYLAAFSVPGLNDVEQLPEKLSVITQRIDDHLSFDRGDHEKPEKFIYYQNLGMQYEVLLNKYENTGFAKEIAEHQKESLIRHSFKGSDSTNKFKRQHAVDFLDAKTLNTHFRVLEKLLRHMQKAEKVAEQFFELKGLMMRSITLPSAETALLMRYQTTFERRLSSAIGELLALQEKARR